MSSVMLATVGTGDGIENAIAFSADVFNAEAVFALCTVADEGSIHKLEAICTALEERGLSSELLREPYRVRDRADFEKTYEDCLAALSSISDSGYSAADITVDYTTGTKVMSAALVVAGLDVGVGRYVYVDGNYRSGAGMRVVTTTEQARATAAGRVRAPRDIVAAQRLFNAYQWDAAIAAAGEALGKCAAGEVADRAGGIDSLATAYRHWDRFEHCEARDALRGVTRQAQCALGVDLQHNNAFLALFDPTRSTSEVELLWARLADLLNNAERRMEMGLYDDAIQRAYRATEMLAQIVSARRDPPLDAARGIYLCELPSAVASKWASRADDAGCLSLGLSDLYSLLNELDDPLGDWYAADEQEAFRHALSNRNKTILAHGFHAATENTVSTILHAVDTKARELHTHVERWRERARFVQLP